MIEKYIMDKFIERVCVLKFGFGYKLVGYKRFIKKLCSLPFRSNVSFKLDDINLSCVNLNIIINNKSIPFSVDKSLLLKYSDFKIPYRLSDYDNNIELELANKINNIILGEVNMIDLYDIYMYFIFRYNEIDDNLLFCFCKNINKSLIDKVNNEIVRKKWNNYKTSISVSFDDILSVLEKIVILSEKVLV